MTRSPTRRPCCCGGGCCPASWGGGNLIGAWLGVNGGGVRSSGCGFQGLCSKQRTANSHDDHLKAYGDPP